MRQVEVSKVRAVRKVENGGQRVMEPERPVQSNPNSLCFSKAGFLPFIAMVINCAAQMERKSKKMSFSGSSSREVFGCQRF